MLVRDTERGSERHTRVCDADSNIPALELAAIKGQCLLQAIQSCKFCIAETLWFHLQFILNNSDIGAFTSGKEVIDVSNCGIE